MDGCSATRGRGPAGAGAQRARPRPGARARAAGTSRSSARATETFAQRNLNRSLDEQFAMFEPTVRRARDAGLDVRAYVSMCFGDPWEGDVPVDAGGRRSGKRLFDLGASELSLGDTIGVGTAGPRRGAAARRSSTPGWPSTSSRCTSTTPTARRSPTRYAALRGRRHHVRRQRRRPRRLPVRQERHRQPRHRGPGLDAARPRHRDRRRPRAGWSPPASGWPASSAGRARRPSSGLSATGVLGPVRHNRAHEPRRLPAHRCAEDRHDLPPGPAGPATSKSSGEHDVHFPSRSPLVSPDLFHFRGRARPARPGLGRRAPGTPRATGTRWSGGSAAGRAPSIVSHEILAPAPAEHQSRGR